MSENTTIKESTLSGYRELEVNRIKVLKANSYCCELCGQETKLVHHRDGKRQDHSVGNLQALCNKCHAAFHARGRRKHEPIKSQSVRSAPNNSKSISRGVQVGSGTQIRRDGPGCCIHLPMDLIRSLGINQSTPCKIFRNNRDQLIIEIEEKVGGASPTSNSSTQR